MITPALVALVGDDVTRDSARREAERELLKPEYHHTQPLLVRALRWVLDRLAEIVDKAAQAAPGGGWGLIGLLVLLVGLLLVLRWRFGSLAAASRRGWVFDGDQPRNSDDHRRSAVSAAAAGDWAAATRERFRAVVRLLEERTVIEARLGRTAHEAAADGGAGLPVAASALHAAAQVFDEVEYGGRPATEHGYATVVEADTAASAAQLVLT